MATDATGTPTALGIPKYNPAVDAPSGLGFNAAMDSIDALIADRAKKPAGIVAQEGVLWDGSAWVRYDPAAHTTGATVSGADTDLAWDGGNSTHVLRYIGTGGGALRSVGTPTGGTGTQLTIRNASAASVTLEHLLAGGAGAQMRMTTGADVVLAVNDVRRFVYDGTNWVDVSTAVSGEAWATYVPTWTGTGTNPAIGNGTITGRYIQIGKTVIGAARIGMGSTTTYGSAGWIIGLPVAAQTDSGQLVFLVWLKDASAGEFMAFTRASTATTVIPFSGGVATVANLVTSTVPFTWTTGDAVEFHFNYEAA